MNSTRSAWPAFMSDWRIAESSADSSASSRRATHHPRDEDAPVLERLTQTLDRVAAELGELVQEQDTVVGECSAMYLDAGESIDLLPGGVMLRPMADSP
jgi:hypothetical protein